MAEIAYIISSVAGCFYLIACYRLLQLSRHSGERPEFWLGIYFGAAGQWYVLYSAPYFLGLEAFPPLMEHGVEWIYAVGVIPYLFFIRSAFRPDCLWATALALVSALLLIGGAAASSLGGDFSNSIDDPAYLTEWMGYTIPSVWICCEGFGAHSAAKKRVRMGLCDSVVANRYLLFAYFGGCQIAACVADLLWAHGISSEGAWSALANGLLSGIEIASVATLWLAFFPPLFYRRWLEGRAELLSAPAEGG
jgi:hypothetical protein